MEFLYIALSTPCRCAGCTASLRSCSASAEQAQCKCGANAVRVHSKTQSRCVVRARCVRGMTSSYLCSEGSSGGRCLVRVAGASLQGCIRQSRSWMSPVPSDSSSADERSLISAHASPDAGASTLAQREELDTPVGARAVGTPDLSEVIRVRSRLRPISSQSLGCRNRWVEGVAERCGSAPTRGHEQVRC
jgi:hypothetical protein